jgi:uridylate kinase
MDSKKKILVKITGTVFLDQEKSLSVALFKQIARQIKELHASHRFGIVIGGGNFFRGNEHGKQLGINPSIGHQIGMLATMMNGLLVKDILEQQHLDVALFCAVPSPEVGAPITHQDIMDALVHDRILIFTGGTGNPFFTTDTTAVLRALQMQADELWKGTRVDGIYSSDPKKDPRAQLLKQVTYQQALQHNLGIMDATAFALAQQYKQKIRVFSIFEPNALVQAVQSPHFGSIIE